MIWEELKKGKEYNQNTLLKKVKYKIKHESKRETDLKLGLPENVINSCVL